MSAEFSVLGEDVQFQPIAPPSLPRAAAIEWPTLTLIAACLTVWALATTLIAAHSMTGAVIIIALTIALHSSLQHEALHGHPTRNRTVNQALIFPALGLLIPYGRFRDTHIDHHRDPLLTDPYDDPESNFIDPAQWRRMPRWRRALLRFNNTLAGRVLIGTALAQTAFLADDWRRARQGETRVTRAWLWHIPAVALVLMWLTLTSPMPLWLYLVAAYMGLSLIKIRTFLEHRAHAESNARTVIVERGGLLAFLFLNNNLHAVHHDRPGVAWYALPRLYKANRQAYARANGGYVYRSYTQVARQFLIRTKDPVAHPFWR